MKETGTQKKLWNSLALGDNEEEVSSAPCSGACFVVQEIL